MHVRRALLLFAIVLLLAGVAASISAPQRERDAPEPPPASGPPPRADGEPIRLTFTTAGRPRTRALAAGASARATVTSAEPGQVEIPGLGLTGNAEPGTPAVFALLVSRPGRYAVRFQPAARPESRRIGTLVVRPPAGPAASGPVS